MIFLVPTFYFISLYLIIVLKILFPSILNYFVLVARDIYNKFYWLSKRIVNFDDFDLLSICKERAAAAIYAHHIFFLN